MSCAVDRQMAGRVTHWKSSRGLGRGLAAGLIFCTLAFSPNVTARTSWRIEELALAVQESFPVQVTVYVVGVKPSPAHVVRHYILRPEGETRFRLVLYADADDPVQENQERVRFEARVRLPLRGTRPGEYDVLVNGHDAGRFAYPGGGRAGARSRGAANHAADSNNVSPDERFAALVADADCADRVNELFRVNDTLWLWHRESRVCAENGYRVALFGSRPDRLLCQVRDTIAGPQLECRDEAARDLFQKLLDSLPAGPSGLERGLTLERILP